MQGTITVKEAAKLWNIPENQITRYCRDGRIIGVRKEKGVWMIPDNAVKPVDLRMDRQVENKVVSTARKPFPVGVSNYRELCEFYYYVDKTLIIKDFLDERPKVSLFTRPRRFGKTLTMDMLKTFFELSQEDTSVYFQDKKIWQCGENYRKHQGKYPVIFLSFKDVKCDTWKDTYRLITQIIELEFIRHSELAKSEKVTIRDFYYKIVNGTAEESEYVFSLKNLSQMLREHYGTAPVIIIDEYDTPIQQGHTKDFYDKVIEFMRNLFSGCLKDNDVNLSFGFLTGILRVAKESIFSGLNNLTINSILDDRYSQYFGFTAEEVEEMAAYHGAVDKLSEIREWYDGYRFGDTEIYNPWSVINYFNKNCKPESYWENTGNNAVIGELLAETDEEIFDNLKELLQGRTITTYVDTNVIYPEIKKNPSSVYSFLLVSGYLKLAEAGLTDIGALMCRVSLPNKEIALVYKKEIIDRLQQVNTQSTSIAIQEALYTGNTDKLQKYLQKFLLESVSYYDTYNENSYHMMLLGLCAVMSDKYVISSNREAGEGRYDIALRPKKDSLPGFLIELKAEKDCSEQRLKELAEQALQQIEEQKYDVQMASERVSPVIKYGIAFSNKRVQIAELH